MKRAETLFLFFCFISVFSYSQTKTSNQNVWLHYSGKNKLSEKLSISFEGTMRYTDGFAEKQQWFVRPSVDFQLTKPFTMSVGYSHYNTYVYGNPSLNKITTPEDHLWFQGTYVQQPGSLKITHRLRDELRYVGVAVKSSDRFEIGHYEYRNRLRYMLLLQYPLLKKGGETKISAIVGDEVFMNIGSRAGKTFLNQNRIIGGIGYHLNKEHQIQLAFIQQYIWNYPNTIQENNPTVRVSYVTNFDFSKKKV